MTKPEQAAALERMNYMSGRMADVLAGARVNGNATVEQLFSDMERLVRWVRALYLDSELPGDAPEDRSDKALFEHVAKIADGVNSAGYKVGQLGLDSETTEVCAKAYRYTLALFAYIDALRYDASLPKIG